MLSAKRRETLRRILRAGGIDNPSEEQLERLHRGMRRNLRNYFLACAVYFLLLGLAIYVGYRLTH